MRSTKWPVVVAVIVAAASCAGDRGESARLSADLERDLASASSANLELASGSRGYQQARVVSDLEQMETAQPVAQRPKPKPVVTNQANHESPEAIAPEPAPSEEVAEVVAPQPETSVEAPAAPRVPTVSPRPAPVPVDMSAGGSRGAVSGPGSREGPDWGTMIGVILRGGGADPGHCPPRRRPRGPGVRIPIPPG